MVATTICCPANTDCHEANYDSNLDLTNSLFTITLAELIAYGKETLGQSNKGEELYVAHIKEQKQAIKLVEQQALCLDTTWGKEHLACHGMCPNLLFGMGLETHPKKQRPKGKTYPEPPPRRRRPRSQEESYRCITNTTQRG
jgi:hypothetical protein